MRGRVEKPLSLSFSVVSILRHRLRNSSYYKLPSVQVAFHTLGCRLNQSETSVLAQAFKEEGYEIVDETKNVDVCVINTCTVTGVSDAKCRNSIRKVIRENPKAKVAVIGCYAESGFQSLSEIEGVDLIVGNQEKLNLIHYFYS